MSEQLKNLASLQFTTAVVLLCQQADERTKEMFTLGKYTGKGGQAVDQVGSTEAQDVQGRLQQIQHNEIGLDSRWIYPASSYVAHVFDTFDKLKAVAAAGVQSEVNQALAAAMKRKRDRQRIKGFFGSANTGEQGGTTLTWAQDVTALPAGAGSQTVAVNAGGGGSDVGLNVEKIKVAIEISQRNEVPKEEQRFMGVTSKDNGKLLREIEVLNADYKTAINARLENGYVMEVMGVKCVHSELFDINRDANNDRQLPFWTQKGMHFGTWQDENTSIDKLVNIVGQPWQAYIDQSVGATRIDPRRVIEILCDPA